VRRQLRKIAHVRTDRAPTNLRRFTGLPMSSPISCHRLSKTLLEQKSQQNRRVGIAVEAQVTIRFFAERDDLGHAVGYKVPEIQPQHVQVNGDLAFGWLVWMDLTRLDTRLQAYAGQGLPDVVLATEPDGWQITDVGEGSTANITKTFTLTR
jgi:hypothetical protein